MHFIHVAMGSATCPGMSRIPLTCLKNPTLTVLHGLTEGNKLLCIATVSHSQAVEIALLNIPL